MYICMFSSKFPFGLLVVQRTSSKILCFIRILIFLHAFYLCVSHCPGYKLHTGPGKGRLLPGKLYQIGIYWLLSVQHFSVHWPHIMRYYVEWVRHMMDRQHFGGKKNKHALLYYYCAILTEILRHGKHIELLNVGEFSLCVRLTSHLSPGAN